MTPDAGGTGREASDGLYRDADEPAPAGPREDGGRLPGLHVRAVQVFAAPGELFRRLRRRPAWIGMLTLVVVLTVASVFLTPPELLEEAFRSQMGPEATEADVERTLGIARPLSYASAVLGPLLLTAVLGGLLYFVYTLVLGGEGEFRQLFSVSAHAMLIPTVGGLALLPLMIATGDPEVRLALHLLVPGLDPDGYLHALLRGLNVFSLWTAAVLGVGVRRGLPALRDGAGRLPGDGLRRGEGRRGALRRLSRRAAPGAAGPRPPEPVRPGRAEPVAPGVRPNRPRRA